MRRYGHLTAKIATWQNVSAAAHKAAAGSSNSADVTRFQLTLDANLRRIVKELLTGKWKPLPYLRFMVRDPKQRTINAAPFYDRVVHHAMMNVAGPCFENAAVDFSYACRTGRGNRAAVQRAANCTHRYRYFLKLDVRRYFDSIAHDVLIRLFHRRFKDRDFLTLMERVVRSFHVSDGVGLPIGTLTSQYFANFYLDGLDHWVMETLGCPAYARYMDDIVLWADDETMLETWLCQIAAWLMTERRLVLKGEPHPVRCHDGLSFLGYRIVPNAILLSRPSRKRFSARLREYERENGTGLLTDCELQRRVDALLSFTDVAHCRPWRGKLIGDHDNQFGIA